MFARLGLDFKEALQTLAKQAGVELQAPSSQTVEQDQQRHKLLELNAAASAYFHQLFIRYIRDLMTASKQCQLLVDRVCAR